MITAIKDIYESEDLSSDFEFLCTPLKAYNNFFADQLENTSGYRQVTLQIIHVVSALFAYPMLGLLAGAGIAIKLTGTSSLVKHNQSEKASVEFTRSKVKRCNIYADDSHSSRHELGREMQVVKEIKISKQNVDTLCDSMTQEIDAFTNRYKRVYMATRGTICDGTGEITLQLRTLERI